MVGEKTIKDFEDLDVYKKAENMTMSIYKITLEKEFSRDFGLVNQIRRSAISIISNIAEGFSRGSNKDFAHFLQISKGSCSEVRCQLNIAYKLDYIEESIYTKLRNETITISKMLSSFINYLENSEIKKRKG